MYSKNILNILIKNKKAIILGGGSCGGLLSFSFLTTNANGENNYLNNSLVHTKSNPVNKMFAWGSNKFGQLGISTLREEQTQPLNVDEDLIDVEFIQVKAFGEMTVAIGRNSKNEKKIYGSGRSSKGSLGQGDNFENMTIPTLISNLESKDIKDIAVGEYHILALSEDGNIFSTGRNWSGEIGREGTSTTLSKIDIETKFNQIACGSDISAAVDLEGNIWTWGASIGLGFECDTDIKKPTKLSNFTGGKVKSVSCGHSMLLVLCQDGTLYSSGYDQYGNLGHGGNEGSWRKPILQKVAGINEEVVSIACGDHHWIATTKNGNVYSCGRNREGQLGIGSKSDSALPVQVKELKNRHCKQVAAGGSHSAAILEGGSLFLWGKGRSGQLATRDDLGAQGANRDIPEQVLFFKNKKVIDVALGREHTVCLIEK